VEASEGVAETQLAADAILVYDPTPGPAIERHERTPIRASLSPMNRISGKRQMTISFGVEIKGSGAAGTPPEWGKCLLGCKMAQAISVGVSVTYKPASSGDSSYTLSLYEDGVLYKLWGARGTFSIDLTTGRPGMVNFTFTGADWSRTDASLLTGMSYNSTVPPAFLSALFSMYSYAAVIEKLSFDIGNTVALRTSANASSGNLSAMVTARTPQGTFDPESVLVATKDFFGAWRAGTTMALTTTLGTAAGNICTITAPACALRDLSLADRNGIRVEQWTFDLTLSSGDDELSIVFT
jgi:hypothetical protein